MKILGIGGGSGLSVLLSGLKEISEDSSDGADIAISAVVCVSDDGGSSGALRRAFGIPAVGDLRNCLVALAPDSMMSELFQHRFEGGDGLDGHSLGNLIMAALCDLNGGLGKAVERVARLLRVRGRVLPATEAAVALCAEFADGTFERGEYRIATAHKSIRRIWLDPADVAPAPGVVEAILEADAIVLGPGSLYTSVLPGLLVPAVADALQRTQAAKIFICNLMTQPGETDCFTVADHLRVMLQYLGPRSIDLFVMNSRPLEGEIGDRYLEAGSRLVSGADTDEILQLGAVPIAAGLLTRLDHRVRHDPGALARLAVSLALGAMRARAIVCGSAQNAA